MRLVVMLAIVASLVGGLLVGLKISGDATDPAAKQQAVDVLQGDTAKRSGEGLRAVPKDILSDTSATTVDISNNSLTSLPSEIGELTKVEVLILDDNQLEGALPGEIRKMTNLRVLSARNNSLTGIPAEIGQLTKLETVDFAGNNITGLPSELGRLVDLKVLDFTDNPISTVDLDTIRGKLVNTDIRTSN